MDVNDIIEDHLGKLGNLGYAIRFDLGDAGKWVVDGRAAAATLQQDDSETIETACTIKISKDNLEKLLSGKMGPMLAYTMGKIKIQGSTGVAMKFVSALG